jgi:anti-sigma B factor antagonist
MQENTQVSTHTIADVGVIDIGGDVTSFSEKIIRDTYEKLTGEGFTKIFLNFEKVSYINSAGMAIIISILTKTRQREQTLCGYGLTEHFQKIFNMVGIMKYMAHYENEAAALQDVEKGHE